MNELAQVRRAYQRLTISELRLFLRIRNLPATGDHAHLVATLADHDLATYCFPHPRPNPDPPPPVPQQPHPVSPDLPPEILAYIIDFLADWELASALGIPTSEPCPPDWSRASHTDRAVLTGQLSRIHAVNPDTDNSLTKYGALLAIRFAYVHVLDYFLVHHHHLFLTVFNDDFIPIKASRHGRLNVLDWWNSASQCHPDLLPPPKPSSIAEAVDSASRNGQIASLDWWLNSSYPFSFTEAALEYASARNRIPVLDWWKLHYNESGLALKIGRSVDMASTAGHVPVLEWWALSQLDFKYDRHALQHASCHGKVHVLQWWKDSGLPMLFDQECLVGATRHNRPEVLDWWDKSGLAIQYRMCDIEEALEESIVPGDGARNWWKQKGVDFNANDKEWMKLQSLN